MGGNSNIQQMILPAIVGIGAGYAFPGSAVAGEGFMGSLFDGFAFNSTAALIGGGLATAVLTPTPQVPDFSSNFAEQQQFNTNQQSFTRFGTSQLEGILENGTDFEKNQAFDELRRRGEDSTRLQEISDRSTRTAERQGELDQFVADNAPPSTSEIEEIANQLALERLAGFDEDLDAERVRLKQISASRGTLDSNRNDDLNLRLAAIGAQNKADIRNNALDTATGFQSDIQGIADQGFARLVQGGKIADEQSRFDIGLAEAERRYQEQLRGARTTSQRNTAFQNFQADLDRQLAVFQQRSADNRSQAQLGLGLAQAGLFSQNFAPAATGTTRTGTSFLSGFDGSAINPSGVPMQSSFGSTANNIPSGTQA